MPVIIEDKKTGNGWSVDTDDPALAMEAVRNNLGNADIQLQVRQPAAAPSESGVIDVNEQGNFNIPEPSNFPELTAPGTPMGSDMLSVGPNERGEERTKDMTLMQKLGRIDQALGLSAANQFTLGRISANEPKIRETFGPDWSKFLLGEKPVDQQLEEGADLVGNLPMMATGMVGFEAGPGKFLPSSWLMQGTGLRGGAARTAASPIETALLNAEDAAERGESASPTEGTATAVTLQAIGELLGKGLRAGGKAFRQKDMSALAKSEEKMAPTIHEWEKNLPYGPPSIPNADIRTQLGADVVPVIAAEKAKAPRAYAEMQRDAEIRREGEFGRAQDQQLTMTGQSDTAAGQAQTFKDQALDPNLTTQYTSALQTRMPNAIGYVTRKTPDGPKKTKVIAPPAFLPTLTSSPRAYDAWTDALEGTGGGRAVAEAYARARGAREPGQAEVFWHTIQKLEGGDTAAQLIAKDLKNRLGDINPDLKGLVAKQAGLWQQHRGAVLGDKIYANPNNLDKGAHQVLTDPVAMDAARNAFVAKFTEASAQGKLPKLTDQMRATAEELLGAQKAAQLFRHYDIERQTRPLDEALIKSDAGINPDALTKAPGKWKQALGAVARIAGASPGGIPAMLGAAGPAAARFLRDHPAALSGQDVEGLFSLLRKTDLGPEPIKNRFETARPSLGTGAGTTFTQQRRRQRRDEDKPVRRPGG